MPEEYAKSFERAFKEFVLHYLNTFTKKYDHDTDAINPLTGEDISHVVHEVLYDLEILEVNNETISDDYNADEEYRDMMNSDNSIEENKIEEWYKCFSLR